MEFTAAAIAEAIRTGARTAEEVATEALRRADEYEVVQPQLWISRLAAESVRAAARRVDERISSGEDLPLAGVPFAVKDNLDVLGMETTGGCPSEAFLPERSATVVELLEAAGAVLIGKTNLDQFATGLVGTRSPYGPCRCVFNKRLISGGSSSGSAVAVAAGIVPLALGTDTAGSGRVPAAINGLVGLKPTKGRWSTRGLLPACRSLDCVSVFARTLEDARLVDTVLAHFDIEDSYSREGSVFDTPPTLRIGIPRAADLEFFGDEEAARLYDRAVRRAERLGRLVEIDISPLLECAQLLYSGPWVAERTAALRHLLVRRPSAIHPVVRQIVQAGAEKTAVEAFEGAYALKDFERAARAIWELADVLILPTAPTVYTVVEVLADPLKLNSNLGLYTNFVNLLDMSALALPSGHRADGAGLGVTLIAQAWGDTFLLDLATQFQEGLPMDDAPPLDLTLHRGDVLLAVVGAHLHGMPLHFQLEERNARFVRKTRTAPAYRLYAMETSPPKPALIHVGEDAGAALELEIYEMDFASFGSFVAEVPAPLAIGTVTLEDGSEVKGFVAEPRAREGSKDVTEFGGWRGYIGLLKD